MNAPSLLVRAVSADEAVARLGELADILIDCVEGGASVSFMAPLARKKAEDFWRSVADGLARGDRFLLVAADPDTGDWIGTVMVVFAQPEISRTAPTSPRCWSTAAPADAAQARP